VSSHASGPGPDQAERYPLYLERTPESAETVVPLTISNDFVEGDDNHAESARMWRILADDQTQPTTLLILRVERYQLFVETFGPKVGAEVVCQFKSKVRELLRDTDVLVQVAGDEILVLLDSISRSDQVTEISNRLIAECTYVQIHGQEHIPINIGIGVTRFPDHSRDPAELLRFARIALHQADPGQSGACHFYSKHVLNHTRSRFAMISDLMEALREDRMELYYQPIYDLGNHRMTGVEALVRMRHASGVLIGPDPLINVAEESGLIVPLGRWVLHQACRQLAEWKRSGCKDLFMSINVSPRQIRDPEFINDVGQAVRGAGIQYWDIILEIIESNAIDCDPCISEALRELRSRGARIAIDDFGTGYSSMSYLMRFPMDLIKVDRSFVLQTPFSQQSRTIVSALFAMAQELGLQVIVEGVETKEQELFLKELGCESAQGFLYAQPMCADEAWDFYGLNR
jgi:diguanylate cyclase (GGDEF)-like protein